MKRSIARLGVLAGAVAGLATAAAPALAAPPTGTTGFDEAPAVVIVGGSDTNYFASTLLTRIYNITPGCFTNNTVAPYDNCVAGQAAITGPYANWDHDVIVDQFPVGSGSGRNALGNAALTTNDIDLGRSSSGIGATTAVNSMFEFASEGLAVVAVNPAVKARTTGTLNVTQAQLQAIYEDGNDICNSTVTWAQLGDTGPNAAELVLPFGMNTGSGTFGSFNTYVGGSASSGDCVLGTPFENDVNELKVPALVGRFNSGQGLWWMSGATLSAFPLLSAGLSPMNLNGVNYTTTTGYALRRNVSYIARDADAAWCTAAAVPVNGCAAASTLGFTVGNEGGKSGAVREYIRWVCRTGNHLGDNTTQTQATPISYLSRISGAIQQAGFSTAVGGTNTLFGRCRAST